jgi:hypothetical protein
MPLRPRRVRTTLPIRESASALLQTAQGAPEGVAQAAQQPHVLGEGVHTAAKQRRRAVVPLDRRRVASEAQEAVASQGRLVAHRLQHLLVDGRAVAQLLGSRQLGGALHQLASHLRRDACRCRLRGSLLRYRRGRRLGRRLGRQAHHRDVLAVGRSLAQRRLRRQRGTGRAAQLQPRRRKPRRRKALRVRARKLPRHVSTGLAAAARVQPREAVRVMAVHAQSATGLRH